jgi:poly(3-hydroxyalkanoate) depolymerase
MSGETHTGPAPIETRMINIWGQRLRVIIRPGDGTRTPLLLMNGVGVNFEVLDTFVNGLDPALEVIRFDVPGTGGSPAPLVPLRFTAHAWLVAEMLNRLDYQQVDVLGLSWGGALAQQFAFQYARRCRRLILVCTGMGALMVPGRPDVLLKMATPRRYMEPGYMERIAGDIYGGSVRTNPDVARQFSKSVRSGGLRGYYYQVLGGAGWTSLPFLPLLRQPTLILAGDDDPLIPVVNAEIMHRLIRHSRLHVFHDGHLGLATQRAALTTVIEEFLTEERA